MVRKLTLPKKAFDQFGVTERLRSAFARVPGGKPAPRRPHLRLDGGTSDVEMYLHQELYDKRAADMKILLH